MQKSPKLREAQFEDHSRVAALAAKFDLRVEDYAEWTHLWSNNPAWREKQAKFPIGWVLETGDGEIVGYLGNIPMAYELRGRRLLAATTRAWVVDTPYRAYSPLLLATYFQQRNVDLFLSTTVNSQSEAAYSSFASIRVPVGLWNRALFWITDYRGFVASYLRSRERQFAGPVTYPLSAGLLIADQLRGSRSLRPKIPVPVIPCTGFDESFQAFWDALRQAKPNVLLADRSPQALDWHFRFALQKNLAWIYVAKENSTITAYSIFQRYDYQRVGLTRVRLVDFQCLDRDRAPDVLIAMLRTAIERCRLESIHMLELVGVSQEFENSIQHACPRQRPLGSWLYFYKTNDASLAQDLKDPVVWEPSLFDGDSSL